MGKPLQEVLVRLLDEHGMDVPRLADSTGVPRKTLDRWVKNGPDRVHLWQALVKIARALNLDRAATNELLEAGGKPTLDNLISLTLDEADRALLDRWVRPASGARSHHLTNPLTSFVGRQEDVTRIANLLATPAVRFVTLTGPGGSGKTRLALEVVQSMRVSDAEICFVDLSSVRRADMVIPTITEALDLKETLDASPVETLANDLRNRNVLLVLDNFEQVTRGALPVVRVLEKCPTINVLATSRTRLRVRGEHEYAVPPLPLPAPGDPFDVLQRNPAVTLFVDRAKAADSSFDLTAQNAPLVAEICVRVDGLPLGIELAAARTRRMRPAAILERFHGGLAMADGGPRDVPERQRTLQATIAWSYDLLDEVDRRIFAFMGSFPGGLTLEAATSVLAQIGLAECPVMTGVERLVDDSLITQVSREDDEPRYEMLETIREFATERLAESDDGPTAYRSHVAYYLALAERATLEGTGQAYWLPRLAADWENFQASLAWCRDNGEREMGLRLSIALMPLWRLRDQQRAARSWLATFMNAQGEVAPTLLAKGMLWEGLLLMRGEGDTTSSMQRFNAAIALFDHEGDLDGASEARQAIGDAFGQHGDWVRSRPYFQESLDLAMQAGNAYLTAHGYMGLALVAQEEGDFEAAQENWERTLAWAEKSGNQASVSLALNSLGEMARGRAEWSSAAHYYEQALQLARTLGSEFRIALALHNLGYVSLHDGHPEVARRQFIDSLWLYETMQHRKGMAECLAGLARVDALTGYPERAARLAGASEAVLQSLGTRLDAMDRADYAQTLESLRDMLGERLDAFLSVGRAMPLKEATELAVASRFDPVASPRSPIP